MADNDFKLYLEHVPSLVEHLSKFAYKWRDIGTALKFQPQDLRNIEACPVLIPTGPSSFLQRLVEEWLGKKFPYTVDPTLANLLKALRSNTVGLGTLATQISDLLQYQEKPKEFVIASVSDEGKLKNKITDIKVDGNTCVNLVITTTCKYPSFKWKNTLGIEYPHEDGPVLCIPKTDIDMDGSQYSCEIECYSGRNMMCGELEGYKGRANASVTLRVLNCPQLDPFKESLASIYLAQPEVPQDSWPPVGNKTYINLALIKQQQIINYGGEYAHLTVRGDMDDILHHKEEIKYENIFDGLRSGSLLLIEGRPGSGKTTFVHKITRDWAASKVLGPRRLLLLVSLRVLNSWEKPVTLEDILELLNMQVSATVLQERHGKGVCFVFDGLDEFSPPEREKSIVHRIINKVYLPQATVIVASRPAALVNLRQKADKAVEVIGFPKDQIFEYAKNYPFSDASKADQLKLYLLSHPNVLHMCYLPIHAAMVAFLFKVIGQVPCTETEIYKHFTRFTLMRSLSKHKGQDELEDMDTGKLSGKEKKLFDTICEFALEKTVQQKQVLDQDEMKLRLRDKGCRDISLGLVTVDRTAGLYGFKNIYTFLHLTYQEYLAAHHISMLSDEDQHKLIKQYRDEDHMQAVWKFYFGLVNFEGHEYKIEALISGRNKIGLLDIQRAYESQQEMVCSFFMTKMDARIILEDKYLTTTDFTALGYLLANSSIPVSLSLIKCDFSAESANILLAEIEGKLLSLHALHCKSSKTDLAALVSLLRNSSLENLKELSLTNIDFEPKELLSMLDYCKELNYLTLNCIALKENFLELLLFQIFEHKKLEKVMVTTPHLTLLYQQDTSRQALELKAHDLPSENLHIGLSRVSNGLSDIVNTSLAKLKEFSLKNINFESEELLSMLDYCKELNYLTLNYITLKKNILEPLLFLIFEHKKLEKVIVITPYLWLLYEQDTRQALELDVHDLPSENLHIGLSRVSNGLSDIVNTSLAKLKELSLKNINFESEELLSMLDYCKELNYLTLNCIALKENFLEPLLFQIFEHKKLEKVMVTTPHLTLLYQQDTSRQALELKAHDLPSENLHIGLSRVSNGLSDIVNTSLAKLKEFSLKNINFESEELLSMLDYCKELNYLTLNYITLKKTFWNLYCF